MPTNDMDADALDRAVADDAPARGTGTDLFFNAVAAMLDAAAGAVSLELALEHVAAVLEARAVWLSLIGDAPLEPRCVAATGVNAEQIDRLERNWSFSAGLLEQLPEPVAVGRVWPREARGGHRDASCHREFLVPLGLDEGDFALLDDSPDGRLILHVAYAQRGRPLAALRARFERLAPLSARAAQLAIARDGYQRARRLGEQMMECSHHAILCLDPHGRVIRANRVAQRLAAADGLCVRDGRLWIGAQSRRRVPAIVLAAETAAECITDFAIPRPGGGMPRHVVFVRLLPRETTWTQEPALLVFTHAPDEGPGIDVHRARRLFGLTAAEARIALLLVDGLSLQECAERLHRSIATARNLLKRVFRKTGVSSQSALVTLILRSTLALDFSTLAGYQPSPPADADGNRKS